MIIIYDKLTYKVTRYSATRKLKRVLADELKKTGKYSAELCESMLDEIIENTKFPEILDENKIFVYDENSKSFTGYKLDDKIVKEKKVLQSKISLPSAREQRWQKKQKQFSRSFRLTICLVQAKTVSSIRLCIVTMMNAWSAKWTKILTRY